MTIRGTRETARFPAAKDFREFEPGGATTPTTMLMTKVWLAAGFHTERVDIPASRRLVFRRVKRFRPPPSASSGVEAAVSPGELKPRRHPGFGLMKGLTTIAPGTDLTASERVTWASVKKVMQLLLARQPVRSSGWAKTTLCRMRLLRRSTLRMIEVSRWLFPRSVHGRSECWRRKGDLHRRFCQLRDSRASVSGGNYSLPVLSPEVLIDSSVLPGKPPNDPIDRIIIATARQHDLTLVTRGSEDHRLRLCRPCQRNRVLKAPIIWQNCMSPRLAGASAGEAGLQGQMRLARTFARDSGAKPSWSSAAPVSKYSR